MAHLDTCGPSICSLIVFAVNGGSGGGWGLKAEEYRRRGRGSVGGGGVVRSLKHETHIRVPDMGQI